MFAWMERPIHAFIENLLRPATLLRFQEINSVHTVTQVPTAQQGRWTCPSRQAFMAKGGAHREEGAGVNKGLGSIGKVCLLVPRGSKRALWETEQCF